MGDERSQTADERSVPVGPRNGGGVAVAAGATVQDRETGRFSSGHSLTDKQRAYVREYARNGGQAVKAATAAGYGAPGTAAWDLARNPVVVAEIRRAMGALVLSEGVTVGVSTLLEVARDRGQSGAARTSAATKLVEMGGFLARHGQGGAAQVAEQKAPSEMSVAELDQVAAGLLQAMTRAKVAASGGDPASVTLDVTPNAGDGADET